MDECHKRNQRCRMICTQPRRLYAHINAERLAELRGEAVGQTVGYQIRLESKVSPKTLLTFCTHGVLLRTVYADSSMMAGTTHILVDEIDEEELSVKTLKKQRKMFNLKDTPTRNTKIDISSELVEVKNANEGCGILLSLIPSLLIQFPHLKVVLMVNLRKSTYDSWFVNRTVDVASSNTPVSVFMDITDTPKNVSFHSSEHQNQKNTTIVTQPPVDVSGMLTNLHQCILAGWFPVDFQHTETGLTALMVCSAAGLVTSVERLLGFGADVFLRVPAPYDLLKPAIPLQSDMRLCGPKHRHIRIGEETVLIVGVNAYDLACIFGHTPVAVALLTHMACRSLRYIAENYEAVLLRFGSWFANPIDEHHFGWCKLTDGPNQQTNAIQQDEEVYLSKADLQNSHMIAYHVNRNNQEPDTAVDFDLITQLLKKIDTCMPKGDILIFLPSYEEIIMLRERLLNAETSPWSYNSKYVVLILHSRMLVADLSRVYAKLPPGVRKVASQTLLFPLRKFSSNIK
ncbi:uncharacterized protein DEA37_0004116 [Paragonimus westermani]|uniref:Uncharacterized protein n=1 Tax=Paragonimus westermani TaxID=34504 RepID=A0A5J4NKL9_9TREM|nr:uncharacterized protein DEA37_0004116 [Paragonimus westermani]